ncbi:MAG: hypothetical protein ACPHY8_05550 [Patescibacteria group bacterium]
MYINDEKISHTIVQENGSISFVEEIFLEKSNDNILVEIKKS